jgi:hypothetical protein
MKVTQSKLDFKLLQTPLNNFVYSHSMMTFDYEHLIVHYSTSPEIYSFIISNTVQIVEKCVGTHTKRVCLIQKLRSKEF